MAYEKECSNLLRYCVERQAPLYEIVFFLTNRCNQRCLTCWQWEEDFKTIEKELSDEMWMKLLQESIAMEARHLYIVGGGEPMVRGNLVIKLAEFAKQRGMFCVLHTNGTLFKKEQMDKLISLKWDQIIFSIDGPNPEINNFIRGEGTFEKAFQNLMYISQNRNHLIPDLGINVTITNKNYLYLKEMVDLAVETGCGGIHATLVQPFNKQAEQFVLEKEEVERCKEILISAKAKAEIAGLYHTFDSVLESFENVNNGQNKDDDKNDLKNGRNNNDRFVETYCFEPVLSMTISADGKVSPCCMFWNKDNPSVHDYSLSEIWKGPFFNTIREQLQKKEAIPDICINCPSQLRQRSENIRKELKTMGEKTTKNPILLIVRFLNRIKKEGFSSALKRVKEWLYIRAGKV
ncbi:MAG TPA: radical SAM protein [Candidatus Hydrogenedens sp.]|nr:radical SAM protein [Candidatus Hydrogenedens sp.]